MPLRIEDTFRSALAGANRALAGMWVCSGSPLIAELCAGSGLDWLLVDAEHSPNGLESILAQLQAIHGYPVHTLVRPPVNDTVVIKQYLDLGVQNLLIPMVNSVAEAEAAVAEADRMALDIKLSDGKQAHGLIAAATVRGWLSFTTTADGTLRPFVDSAGPDAALKAFAPQVAKQPVEPEFIVDGKSVVGIIPGKDGATLDASTTATRILQILAARSHGTGVSTAFAAITPVKPKLSDQEAASAAPRMQLISTWTTYFMYGIGNKYGANIWIPAREIDGTVLAPREKFDFWKRIGPVTLERGYGLGGAIINGHTEPQGALAGGICSNSTTLFNAALRAGLEMGARKNHYYYINRYPMGLDATVFKSSSGSTQTMSFTNDTPYPLLIRGYKIKSGGKGYVRFDLYSVPNGRKVVIGSPTIKNVRPAWDTVQYTSTLPPGTRKRIESPVDGKDVWRTVTVRENGKIIHQWTYYSHYSRITGVLLVGTGGSTSSSPSPSPSP